METPLQLVIGIDGGATYSHGVAATHDGRVLSVVHSASMNFTGSYQKEVRRRVSEILHDLELQLPFSNEFTHYAVSAAGIFNEATTDQKEKLCGKIYPWKRTRLVGDSVAAFQGATLGRPGVLVICGTGTSIIACNEDGEFTHHGGWGPLLDDVGSAYWIAVKCIRAAIAEFEQTGPATSITDALCGWYEVKNVQGLIPVIYHPEFTRDKFAILASKLDREIGGADPVYQQICREAGEAVANACVYVAVTQLTQRPSCPFSQRLDNFDAVDIFDEGREHRRLITAASPDFENAINATRIKPRFEFRFDQFCDR